MPASYTKASCTKPPGVQSLIRSFDHLTDMVPIIIDLAIDPPLSSYHSVGFDAFGFGVSGVGLLLLFALVFAHPPGSTFVQIVQAISRYTIAFGTDPQRRSASFYGKHADVTTGQSLVGWVSVAYSRPTAARWRGGSGRGLGVQGAWSRSDDHLLTRATDTAARETR